MAKKTSYALKQLIPEENPKTGAKYIFYIREHRIISRCGGSQLIYGWTDKGKQILENLRAQVSNKSKHSNEAEAASGV